MAFDGSRYGRPVKELLALDGAGTRLMPLVGGTCSSPDAPRFLRARELKSHLAGARSPEGALAGLWLYFSCMDEAHEISQAMPGADGAFWHGILHRREPDAWNAKYWFRRVGAHPVFAALTQEAKMIAQRADSDLLVPSPWNAEWFVDLCDGIASQPEHPHHRLAQEIQLAEWQLLFDYCASPKSS